MVVKTIPGMFKFEICFLIKRQFALHASFMTQKDGRFVVQFSFLSASIAKRKDGLFFVRSYFLTVLIAERKDGLFVVR